jgi:hypothetical protein
MVSCHIGGHPGIHAVAIPLDAALPTSCGDQSPVCMADDAAKRRAVPTDCPQSAHSYRQL